MNGLWFCVFVVSVAALVLWWRRWRVPSAAEPMVFWDAWGDPLCRGDRVLDMDGRVGTVVDFDFACDPSAPFAVVQLDDHPWPLGFYPCELTTLFPDVATPVHSYLGDSYV